MIELTNEELELVNKTLAKVLNCLEYDKSLDAMIDGGRFTMMINQENHDVLTSAFVKMAKAKFE